MSLEVAPKKISAGTASLRARAHPLRLQMLSLLTGAAMSAAELARELDISQALASYHLRFLVDAHLVDLAEEFSNRGGRERRYRYHADHSDRVHSDTNHERGHSEPQIAERRDQLIAAVVDELLRRDRSRDSTTKGLLVDAELWVSDDEWKRARDQIRQATLRLHDVAVRPRTPGSRPVNATVVMFGMQA